MRPSVILEIGRSSGGSSSGYTGGSLDTQTVTIGSSGTSTFGTRIRGFVITSLGSLNDGTSNLYGGAVIREIAAEEQGVGAGFNVVLEITGVVANSGWTSMNVGGTNVLLRSNATFTAGGGSSFWEWAGAGNLFPGSGSIVVGFD